MIRRASVLLCIVQEVVEYLTERVGVKQSQRQIRLDIEFDCHIGILEPVLLLLNTLLDRSAQVPGLWGGEGRCPLESCEIQHIAHHPTEAVGFRAHRRRITGSVLRISEILCQHLGVQQEACQRRLELVGGGGRKPGPLRREAVHLEEDPNHRRSGEKDRS